MEPPAHSVDPIIDILDGASPNSPPIDPSVAEETSRAADESAPVTERIAAFEELIDAEVGDSNLVRARNLERETSLRQIFLKFEGSNPTGTQKDRIAFAQVLDAMRRGYQAITVATCGNYGSALALAASLAGLRCVVFIPENYHTKRIHEMVGAGAEINKVSGDYEQTVSVSRSVAETEELYDANPGGNNTSMQLSAYAGIAYEIYDELRDAPAVVTVPVSNGTTLAGIYKGFQSLYRRGKTSRIPKMFAGSAFGKNPIVQSFRKNLSSCEDLQPTKIRETWVNEPLVNWHSIDGDLALDAIRSSGGLASYVADKTLLARTRQIKDREGLTVLPGSTAGLAVLLEEQAKKAMPGDRYVAIITGRRR